MYDTIGTLFEDETALPGWHVNSPFPVEGWEQYQVTPTSPRRVFAGHPTFFYVFDNQEVFDNLTKDTEPSA
jgi:hypothetical protein